MSASRSRNRQLPQQRPQEQSLQARVTAVEQRFHSGPLPSPEDLARYEDVLPGLANRIVSLAENQSAHRQELERTVIRGDSKRSWAGLAIGAIVALSIAGGAFLLIDRGHDVAGAVVGGLDVSGMVGTFVYGNESRRRERARQR